MAIPRVFVSSTCYDLADVRDGLASFISNFGFEPCLSERGDIFYHPDLHTHDSCVNEIRNCQLFILVIGGRFGGHYKVDPKKSIVNAEYSAAKELGIPVFTFIKKEVLDDHRVFQKNKDKTSTIDFPSIENQSVSKNIFEFIDEVRSAKVNNGFFPFEYSRDLENLLRKQWAGMFFEFLQNRSLKEQYDSQNRVLSNLTVTSSKLEELVKSIYLQVDKKESQKVIEEVDNKALAEKMFVEIFSFFDLKGFYKSTLKDLKTIRVDLTWYEYLSRTKDFSLQKGHSSDSDRLLFSFQAKIWLILDDGFEEVEKGWEVFKKLNEKQRAEVLSKFVSK